MTKCKVKSVMFTSKGAENGQRSGVQRKLQAGGELRSYVRGKLGDIDFDRKRDTVRHCHC